MLHSIAIDPLQMGRGGTVRKAWRHGHMVMVRRHKGFLVEIERKYTDLERITSALLARWTLHCTAL